MTSEDKMREDFEIHFDIPENVEWSEKSDRYICTHWRSAGLSEIYTARLEAWMSALHSVEAEKEPEWIRCDDRIPTEADGDCDLCVWAFNPRRGVASKIKPDSVEGVNFTHWMPTGLVRPAPPEHKPE